VQVKGLVAGDGGQALDRLSLVCHWVLTSWVGRERQQKFVQGTLAGGPEDRDEHPASVLGLGNNCISGGVIGLS
jgi:hypothetical protein